MKALAALRDGLTGALAPLLQRWRRLDLRQQRTLGAGALLLVVAVLFAYLWLPAVRERERLAARLPQLRAQLALMQQQADEIRRLTSTSLIAPAPPTAADTATLQSAFGEGARASTEPNRAFRVVIPRIAYATWWDRLGDVQSRHQLDLLSLSLQALPGNAHEVSVDMLLTDRMRGSTTPSAGPVK